MISHKEKKPKKYKGMKIEVDIENKVKKPVMKKKMNKVVKEFKEDVLNSRSKKGPVEKKPKKSIEISYSEAKRSKKKK